jgi:hypothetical protein
MDWRRFRNTCPLARLAERPSIASVEQTGRVVMKWYATPMSSFFSGNLNPEWIWGIAIAALGVVLVWITMRAGKLNRAQRHLADAATKARYQEESKRQRE